MIKRFLFAMLALMLTAFAVGCSGEYLVRVTSQNINSYTIEAQFFDDSKTVEVLQAVDFKNRTGHVLENLKFNLHPKAFAKGATNKPVGSLNEQKAYPNGKSYGDIVFSSIEIGGTAAQYKLEEIDKDILNITLQSPLRVGAKTKIVMSYTITLPNIHHRFGYGDNAVNLGNFYPVLCVYEKAAGWVVQPYSPNGDPFYSDVANYIVTFTYPQNFVLATTGKQTNTQTTGQTKKTTSKALAVRDFAAVLSSKFELLQEKVKNVVVKYYYYDDERAQESLETAKKALKTFDKLIGDYPYDTLSVVQTNFVHGGMEYPNLVYVSDALNNYSDYANVIIHEIAHQWWYGVVGNNAYKNGWLDEGLTEYTTLLFYEHNPEYNIKRADIISNALTAYNMFVQVYEDIFGKVDTTLTRTLGEYKTEPEYVYMAYVKAMLLFEELRATLGDKRFFKALRNYYNTYKMQNVTPSQLISSFEKSTGRTLAGWFDSWMSGRVIIKELN